MAGEIRALPVRVYEAGVKIMVAAPMPGFAPDDIALETIEATRGERVGHVGRVPRPTTTAEHRGAKHAA